MTTAVVIAPAPVLQFADANGAPLVGGLLFVYAGGTTNKITTYADSNGATPNPNPIVLNALGEAPPIFIPPQTNVKFVLAPAGASDPPSSSIWTVDNILAPSLTSGTMALQDATSVNITGGKITVNTLTITGVSNLATLNLSDGLNLTNETDRSKSQAGTLTNAPSAGNPGFWLRITVNGTAYGLPLWVL